jgi:hypothetical protein
MVHNLHALQEGVVGRECRQFLSGLRVLVCNGNLDLLE